MQSLIILKEALRMFKRARRIKKDGFPKYEGTPEEICREIIESTYDEKNQYFMTSTGNFCEFYVRDFAFCCEALCELGYQDKVRNTMAYALERFSEKNTLTTTINPIGEPFDYFMKSGPETPALLLFTLNKTGNQDLIGKHKTFLQRQILLFARRCVDKEAVLPKAYAHFSTIRDQTKRIGSCYDMVMLCLLARESKIAGMNFPYTEAELKKRLIDEYWNGTYFFQDLNKQDIVIGDANTFPFWTGIIDDNNMLEEAMTAVQAVGLDNPFPLRYVSPHDAGRESVNMHFANLFIPNYETDSIWAHMGLAYIKVLASHNKEKATKHLEMYRKLIEKHRNFIEVYDTNGEILESKFYISDDSMLWCANWLALEKKLNDDNNLHKKVV